MQQDVVECCFSRAVRQRTYWSDDVGCILNDISVRLRFKVRARQLDAWNGLLMLGNQDQSDVRLLDAQICRRTQQLLARFILLINPELAGFGGLKEWLEAGQSCLDMDIVAYASPLVSS